ncbi:serine hydrolase [Brachybacterium vulturis]|uniref:serine hydrolase n=1 Tax=Brachybacterium vulturis TaxID=2017484 RepID=UPI003734F496
MCRGFSAPRHRLAARSCLPLVGQPGTVWRYHHFFGLLGILLSRVSGTSTGEHLDQTLWTPVGMSDTRYSVPPDRGHRLPALYADEDGVLGGENPRPADSTSARRRPTSATASRSARSTR